MFKQLFNFIIRTSAHQILINFQKEINEWEEQGVPLTYHNLNVKLNQWIKKTE